ncbi:H(+)/Cl(-) exchange transporter ClcA [Gallaecimonas sp. GXIMD4217]|uniref:H(+)/Cl(-) exchange transporter ClcA n=1 Tax=Gallaecimonas sp. GXIMD4217 TaxID=3131927 RepID=UPI00311ADC25
MPDASSAVSREERTAQPSGIVRLFKAQNITPVWLLLLAALVGVLAGLVATLFEYGVHQVLAWRANGISLWSESGWPRWLLAALSSGVMAGLAIWLTYRFAPEAAGSGIPEIEGAMDNIRPLPWWRVLPVKLVGGFLALGGGLVLGSGGPATQMGAHVGRMIADICRLTKDNAHMLLATGAAGGLSAAFNAPLAGVMLVVEEMRPQFRYNLISVKCVLMGAILANIVFRAFHSQDAIIEMPSYAPPALASLWLFLLLGFLFGAFGIFFNKAIQAAQDGYSQLHGDNMARRVALVAAMGALMGWLTVDMPALTGSGVDLIPNITVGSFTVATLALLCLGRLLTTLICFGANLPGGIFAPMLTLGTLFGMGFGQLVSAAFPQWGLEPGTFAIAGMGALFAATVRAPLTGIILVIEMTDNYLLILPLLLTCLGATMVAQALGGQPLYAQLLKRMLERERAKA